MDDVKGIQKFAEDFLVGAIGLIYSSAYTLALILRYPIKGPSLIRIRRSWTYKPIPAPVSLLLAIIFYEVFLRIDNSIWTGDFSELRNSSFSGAHWYHIILAIVVLYISIDILLLLTCNLLSKGKSQIARDRSRLMYCVATFAVFFNVGTIITFLAINLYIKHFATLDSFMPVGLFYFGVFTFGVLSICPLVLNLAIVLHRKHKPINQWSKFGMYASSAALVGAAIFLCDGVTEFVYGTTNMMFEDTAISQFQTVTPSDVACLLTTQGRVTVTTVLNGSSFKNSFVSPSEIMIELTSTEFGPAFFDEGPFITADVELKSDSGYPLLVPAKGSLTVTLSGTLDPHANSWPLNSFRYCRLHTVKERRLDRSTNFDSAFATGPTNMIKD